VFDHDRALFADDGIHPTAEGYRYIAQLFAEHVVSPSAQHVPEILYAPSVTSSPATGVIVMTGLTPGSPVGYQFRGPDGALLYETAALSCGTGQATSADSFGGCSFRFESVPLAPGMHTGLVVDSSGASDSASLLIE
jgi:hypothetical protein